MPTRRICDNFRQAAIPNFVENNCELHAVCRRSDPEKSDACAGKEAPLPNNLRNDQALWPENDSSRIFPHAVAELKILALLLLLVFGAVRARATSEDGSIGGLKAKFVDVNGIRTRYYEAGKGQPMVLIHAEEGFSGHASANYFAKNIPGLARHYHVFALDRLGSGLTDNPKTDKDYNIHAEMDHIVQFIQTLKLGKVHLVGHSTARGWRFSFPWSIRTLSAR